MYFRCRIDGLILPAELAPDGRVRLYDGEESFVLEAAEAAYYEADVPGSLWLRLAARYRLLRRAPEGIARR